MGQQALSQGSMTTSSLKFLCECGNEIDGEYLEEVNLGSGIRIGGKWVSKSDKCESCKQNHQLELEKRRAEKIKLDAEVWIQRRERELEFILGGAAFAEKFRFGKFKTTAENKNLFDAMRCFNNATDNFYIFGPCGTGKTHLASAVAVDKFLAGKSAVVIKPGPFTRSLRLKSAEEQEGKLRYYASRDVLVFDDLGIGSNTAWALEQLQEVLDIREGCGKNGLIVTSNLSPSDLAEKLGDDRVPSRLMGMCRVIKTTGEDWRIKK